MMWRFLYSSGVMLGGVLLGSAALAQVVSWKSFTSVGEIRDIATSSDAVWAAASGGALRLRLGESVLSQFTNTEGLSQNDVTSVAIDREGNVWLALQNGLLNRFSPEGESDLVIDDYREQAITDVVIFGDSLYVGLDVGVSLYNVENLEVKETYQNLGLSTGGEVEKIGANAVTIAGSDIWVSTNRGIAQSSLMLPNLQAPSSWKQHRTQNGLPSNTVRAVAFLGDTPYAATSGGIARLAGDSWVEAGLSGTSIVNVIAVPAGDFPEQTLAVVTSGGVFILSGIDTWSRLGPALSAVSAISASQNGRIWIGQVDKGLAQYDIDSDTWPLFPANAPGSSDFLALTLDQKGRLWCASQTSGINLYDNGTWKNFNRSNGLPTVDYRTILTDANGRVWAGSWGGGITILEESGEGFAITTIDTAGGILSGFGGDRGFVLVPKLLEDQFRNIWILNRQAFNTRVLLAHTPQEEFEYFSTGGAVTSSLLTSIEIDRSGRVWIGSEDRGIQVIDYQGTLTDRSDDNYNQGLNRGDDLLYSNFITALAEDRDGVMWIGTNAGLNLWFSNIVDDEFNTPVNAIGIDAVDNKWIGTQNGISIFRGHRDKIGDLTIGNSDLVSGNVLSFAFNAETGEVWIGTDNGLSLARTFFTAPKEDFNQLTGFPNPFILDGSGSVFTITNLSEGANVNIYNSAGRLVKSFTSLSDIQGAQAFWDGTDQDNKAVASGIYVYLAFTDNDISAKGKVAVIRR